MELYRAQISITAIALAILAATAIQRGDPLFLEWNNAGAAFHDPIRASLGTVLLSYQLGYFDILPLYVVLLLMAPFFILLARRSQLMALGLSLAIYLAAVVTRSSLPSWPSQEPRYFNPLCWQLLLVLGYLTGHHARFNERLVPAMDRLWPFAALSVLAGCVLIRLQIAPDPMIVPEPRMLFLFDKRFLSPARIFSLAAICLTFAFLFQHVVRHLPSTTAFLCSLGRNSLAVFCVSSLWALVGQIVRYLCESSFLIDTAIVGSGLGLMGFTAWFVEWRSRAPGQSSQGSLS